MQNKFEMMPNNIKEKNFPLAYHAELERFMKTNKLKIHNSGKIEIENGDNISSMDKYTFQENPENPEGIELENPEFLNSFFESKGYGVTKPKSIINKGGTTLFISAGVQVLDDVVFNEKKVPEKKIFVSQPVFRTQYMDQVGEGFSTTFINIASEIVNPSVANHFDAINDWVCLLEKLGLKKEKITLKTREKEPQWGDKKFKDFILMIYYDGLEIGDANYIYDIPQKTRDPLKISDIGFGLERIKWILKGGSYFNEREIKDPRVFDYCKTIALLTGSGLKPSNKEHGYRLRQLSKRLIDSDKKFDELIPVLKYYYNYWKKWTYLTMPESGAIEVANTENKRNSKNVN